ncbi:MAG TPA: hypothetical protein VH538_07095 [Gaiellaceae bacterium]
MHDLAQEPSITRRYEIRIRGQIGDELASYVGNMTAEVLPVETVLRGDVADQAALHGMLDHVQSLGLELIEIRLLATEPGSERRAGSR